MASSNKLLIINGVILVGFSLLYVIFFYLALAFIASQPATIAMLHYFLYWMWLYLILSIGVLIVGIVASKKGENSWAIGGVSIGITAATTIYHLYFLFRVAIPYIPLVPPTMTMVMFVTLLIYTVLVVLALVGGIIKIATAGSGSA